MKNIPNDNHFEILGVTRFSTKVEIKKAYRDAIKKWHPDKFPISSEKSSLALEMSKKINEAFSLLEHYTPIELVDPKRPVKSSQETAKPSKGSTNTSSKSGNSVNIVMVNVKSSNIRSVGYDKLTSVFQIEFLNGYVYRYYDVPESIFLDLLNASSKGKFFNRYVSSKFRKEML